MDPISYAESFFAVAEAFLAKRHYQKALEVLSYLTSDDRTNTPIIWNRAAKCHHMLGNLDFAVELYLSGKR